MYYNNLLSDSLVKSEGKIAGLPTYYLVKLSNPRYQQNLRTLSQARFHSVGPNKSTGKPKADNKFRPNPGHRDPKGVLANPGTDLSAK